MEVGARGKYATANDHGGILEMHLMETGKALPGARESKKIIKWQGRPMPNLQVCCRLAFEEAGLRRL